MKMFTNAFTRRFIAACAIGLALTATLEFIASAQSGSAQYTGCLRSGNLQFVAIGTAPLTRCPVGSVQVTWGESGAPGPQGPIGPQGIQGPQGPQGPAGTSGVLTGIELGTASGETPSHTEVGCVIPGLGGGCLQFGQIRVIDGPMNVSAQCAAGKRPVSLQTTVDGAFAFGDFILPDGTVTTDLSQATGGKAKDPGGTQIHSGAVQLVCADAL